MSTTPSASPRAIAIVGMSGRFPGARSLEQFWQNLRDGVESLDTFTEAELDAAGVDATTRALPGWVPRGTVLQDADHFDAAFFGYSPREAQIIDPQQRVFLECAWEAMEHAGYAREPDGAMVAVYAGSSINSYVYSQLLPNRELLASVGGYQVMLGNDKDFLTTRASYKLDLHGPSMAIQTACSTSLVAVYVACQALVRRECDMALAGGVSITFPQRTGYQYQEGMIFSPDGSCRPFDADSKGTRAGAGAGIVVLKRLEDALADRDTIHAVILGSAINNDGAGKAGYTAPSIDGQMEVIATAQALAGVSAESISYVEAHGTATPLGDPIEIAALTRVFRESTDARGFCTIGSLKANLGHLDAAAGVAGLIKTVLALQHRELPRQLNFRAPNPQLQLDTSPFRVATTCEPWAAGATPRRAGVSSFGIGGTNAHVVLEEAPAAAPSAIARSHHLVVLSAKTAEALDAATTNLVGYLRQDAAASLADVAYTLQVGRRPFPHRRSVVVCDAAEAITALSAPDRAPVTSNVHEGASRPVAFLFSGQGSQHAGMCAELYAHEPAFRAAVDRCADILHPHFGRDIRELLRDGTDQELSETAVAQPLLFVTGYALAVLWMSWGVQPSAMLGHSIGEYVAAHLAGVFSLEDALMLVSARGRLMQEMPPGEMLAVRLAADALTPRLGPGVEIAAINAPAMCSVSGTREAIAALAAQLEQSGIEHRPLHTSHAFHSAMMEPVLAPFRAQVARVSLSAPRIPYVSNVTGTWIRPEQATSPDYWASHLRGTVRFAEGVATLIAHQSVQLLEVGAGNALASLTRLTLGRDGASRVTASLPHPREARRELETMLDAVGRLWVSGVAVDWAGINAMASLRRVPLPTYPFERKRHWVDAPKPAPDAVARLYRREALDDWFYTPTWTRAPLARNRLLPLDGTWLVFGRADALEAAVLERLRARGASVIAVGAGEQFTSGDERFVVRGADPRDYESLIRTLRDKGADLRGVIHLWNVGPIGNANAARDTSLHAIAALGRALLIESPAASLRLVVGTTGAQSVHGEPVQYADRALSTGPVLVLPMEHAGVGASTIDLDGATARVGWRDEAARQLVEEASIDDADALVAVRSGERWVRRFVGGALPRTETLAATLTHRGVCLVTGGLGGIGVTLAEWLARNVSARLVLTSRTALPNRGEWDAWLAAHDGSDPTSQRIRDIERIEAAGGEVVVIGADIASVTEMRSALAAVEAGWGPVTSVIHAAGIAGDGLLALSSRDHAEEVISAKVAGLDCLVAVLGDHAMEFVVLCSSINVVGGVAGTYAYTAANAYLDAFAVSAQRPVGWRTVSIAWDAWRDVGMASKVVVPDAMRAARAAYVAAGISPAAGADAFARCLESGFAQQVVSPYDIETALIDRRRLRSAAPTIVETRRAEAHAAEVSSEGRPSSAHVAPAGEVEERLASIWEELLGVTPVGVHDNFFDLGGHSLLATRVLARIDSTLGVRLPLRDVFSAPTIRLLGGLIEAQLQSAAVAAHGGEREEFEL